VTNQPAIGMPKLRASPLSAPSGVRAHAKLAAATTARGRRGVPHACSRLLFLAICKTLLSGYISWGKGAAFSKTETATAY